MLCVYALTKVMYEFLFNKFVGGKLSHFQQQRGGHAFLVSVFQ